MRGQPAPDLLITRHAMPLLNLVIAFACLLVGIFPSTSDASETYAGRMACARFSHQYG